RRPYVCALDPVSPIVLSKARLRELRNLKLLTLTEPRRRGAPGWTRLFSPPGRPVAGVRMHAAGGSRHVARSTATCWDSRSTRQLFGPTPQSSGSATPCECRTSSCPPLDSAGTVEKTYTFRAHP